MLPLENVGMVDFFHQAIPSRLPFVGTSCMEFKWSKCLQNSSNNNKRSTPDNNCFLVDGQGPAAQRVMKIFLYVWRMTGIWVAERKNILLNLFVFVMYEPVWLQWNFKLNTSESLWALTNFYVVSLLMIVSMQNKRSVWIHHTNKKFKFVPIFGAFKSLTLRWTK